jgi:(p)ppGpp synthase/HD superfamily hydrolase
MPEATIDDALELVATKFRGVTDKDGEPYIMHCLRVMMGVSDPLVQQVALMHDLVEDTDVTLKDLRDRGFCNAVVEAVDLVTHKSEDSYAEYVIRLASNEIARQVKLSDLNDNYALNRVLYREDRLERDIKRIQRYLLSYQFLMHRINADDYRRRMSEYE